jgi:glycosyltransferase involved in cell wall biosynthesis
MSLMARGIPILASVDRNSEVARIVRESKAGRVVDATTPEEFPRVLSRMLADRSELRRCSEAAIDFAHRHFSPEGIAARFESVLRSALPGPSAANPR